MDPAHLRVGQRPEFPIDSLDAQPVERRNRETTEREDQDPGKGDANKAMQHALEQDFFGQIRKAVGLGLEKRVPAGMISKAEKDS